MQRTGLTCLGLAVHGRLDDARYWRSTVRHFPDRLQRPCENKNRRFELDTVFPPSWHSAGTGCHACQPGRGPARRTGARDDHPDPGRALRPARGQPQQGRCPGLLRGFLIGAGQYHNEMSRVRGARPIFCLPTPSPSIETAQANFVSWAAANPQFSGETAVNSVMRWAETAFPCQPAPSRRTTSR